MLHTLWRRKLTILISAVVATAAALAFAKVSAPTYQSTALIQINAPAQAAATGSSFTVPDPVQELNSTAVKIAAAKTIGATDPSALASQVTGAVDPTTGTLTVTGTGSTPQEAQAITAAYSEALVAQIQAMAKEKIDKYTALLAASIAKITLLQAQLVPEVTGQPGNTGNALVSAQITAEAATYSTLQAAQSSIQVGMPYAIIQVAATPGVSTGLSTPKLIVIGLLAGLLAGCGIAFVRDQFDDRVRITSDIESVIDCPLLGELPEDAEVHKGAVQIAMVQAPQSSLAEAVRDLRTSLRVLMVGKESPIIVVTSPEPGDGKTFVTANLAASWALTGSRVIVVSADFRRPKLEAIFGINVAEKHGLSDLIKANWKQPEPTDRNSEASSGSGVEWGSDHEDHGRHSPITPSSSVSAHLLDTGIDGLQLLPVGLHLDNPSELLDSPGMQPVLDQLHVLADIIFLDTPPVLSSPDTAILGSLTNGAIVVASEAKTDRADLERTANRLSATGCDVLGLVVNHVRRSASDNYQVYASKS